MKQVRIGITSVFTIAAVLAGWPSSGIADDVGYYLLDGSNIICIVENKDIYLSGEDPVFALTDDCPPSRAVTLTDAVRNEMPAPDFSDRADRFIILSHKDLHCLSADEDLVRGQLYKYYPSLCRFEVQR